MERGKGMIFYGAIKWKRNFWGKRYKKEEYLVGENLCRGIKCRNLSSFQKGNTIRFYEIRENSEMNLLVVTLGKGETIEPIYE